MTLKLKQTAYQDIANIIEEAIEEAIDESARIGSENLADSAVRVFELIDTKLMEFFNE